MSPKADSSPGITWTFWSLAFDDVCTGYRQSYGRQYTKTVSQDIPIPEIQPHLCLNRLFSRTHAPMPFHCRTREQLLGCVSDKLPLVQTEMEGAVTSYPNGGEGDTSDDLNA